MAVSRLYGAVPKDAQPGDAVPTRRFWIVLDPTLRILKVLPLGEIVILPRFRGHGV